MTTQKTNISQRPLYTHPILWVSVLLLGIGNVGVQAVRSNSLSEFFTQSVWRWPELSIGLATLALVVVMVISFANSRARRRQ